MTRELAPALRDAMVELVGHGVGRAADVLNRVLNSHIELAVPDISLMPAAGLGAVVDPEGNARLSAVIMRYGGSVSGAVELIFASKDAGALVDCIVGQNAILDEGLDSLRAGTLCEIGNVVLNAILGSLANELGLSLAFSVPSYMEGQPRLLVAEACVDDDATVLLAETRFTIESLVVSGTIALFFPVDPPEEGLLAVVERFLGDVAP